ncbi:MAG: 4-(cytidine 5'-diphospho)-2-C-methyl-D-erythritol kinase [Opitutales bacterium]|nr:4-(cytidine 5'-diphospho)-2-C-methyl-D-erythritol kinase [Opitutales bacterium]
MKARNAISRITLPAPAKINLFLAVTGKREDGFHEINTVLVKLELSDQVILERTDKRDDIECFCSGNDSLSGRNNLAYKAIEEWRKFTGDRTGMKVTIAKRIPAMAGLGGGSSDAVATLRALNLYHGQPYTNEDLVIVAEKLGSDCPYFLHEGIGHAIGRGEKVRIISRTKQNEINGQRIFLFQPPIGFSTPLAYQALAENGGYSDYSWAKKVVEEWETGKRGVSDFCHNDFELVLQSKYLFLKPIFKELRDFFGLSFQVSGSGSSCFCFVSEVVDEKPVRDLIYRSLGIETKFWVSRIRVN